MVRYLDHPFFFVAAEVPVYLLSNTGSVTGEGGFMKLLGDTMNMAMEQAAKGGADKKFSKHFRLPNFAHAGTVHPGFVTVWLPKMPPNSNRTISFAL